jgi:hypothetical protein
VAPSRRFVAAESEGDAAESEEDPAESEEDAAESEEDAAESEEDAAESEGGEVDASGVDIMGAILPEALKHANDWRHIVCPMTEQHLSPEGQS